MDEFTTEAIAALSALRSILKEPAGRSGLIGLEGDTVTVNLSATREDAARRTASIVGRIIEVSARNAALIGVLD